MIDERDVGATSQESKVLESGISLSQSVIWGLQHDYYARRGLKAWSEDNVPSYITSNPFIAEVYAGIVVAFIDDCISHSAPGAARLSPERPLRIMELGAGTGKFAYLFLRKLTALLEEKKIPPQVIRYCVTDCSEDLLAAWKENPYLARFTVAGILEFELLSAGEENSPQSSPHNPAGPLVVIANYVFDSLPLDAFVISQGKMEEALITTSAGSANDGSTPTPGALQLSFNNVPVPQGRYADKVWNGILEHYRSSVPAATIFFPTAALDLLQRLGASSNGCMLVLAADKGFTREENLTLRQGAPQLEFHASGNCFSAIVNFDAIARYFWSTGGEAFLPQKHFSNLSLCAFLQHQPEQEFPATCQAHREASQVFGPDDLFTLMTWLESHLNELTITQALSVLRLTRWDPTALMRLFPVIAPQLRSVGAERIDLRDAVISVMANRFPVSRSDNELAFYCGVILLELRFFAEAIEMFTISEQMLGCSAATSYNLGLCASGMGHAEEALAFMVKACDQDPRFAPAQSARARLEVERKQS